MDTLFILGPNQVHTPQLLQAAKQEEIHRICRETYRAPTKTDGNLASA